MANATNTTPGEIQLAGDLAGNNDATAPELTDTAVTPGAYTNASITVDSKGRVTAATDGASADASSSVQGLAQFGTNITDEGSGVFGVVAASGSTTLGVVKSADTNNITITAGAIDVGPDVLTISTTATAAALGAVKFGTNITDEGSGVFGVVAASGSTTLGVVKSADLNHITITTGDIDVGPNVVLTDAETTLTAALHTTPVALTDQAGITTDAALGNIFTVTLGGNRTLNNPTNLAAGEYTFIISQDGAGSRTLSFGSAFLFKLGSNTTLSTGAGAVDIVSCISDGTSLYCALGKDFE